MDNYSVYLVADAAELPDLLVNFNVAEANLRAFGNVAGADEIIRAFSQLKSDLTAVGITVAASGTDILRRYEEQSRVRPDTVGGGGPRLEDYLLSEPLLTYGGLTWGSVGVANETLLDNEVEWWWTNEEGYSGHVGRVLYGTFEPGGAPPDASAFREHPLFDPHKGASGVIRNPIPARHFVRDAAAEIAFVWQTAFDSAVDAATARCYAAIHG